MKERNNDVSTVTKFIVFFIVSFSIMLLSECILPAQNTGWKKIQEVEIPAGLEIQSGINSEGMPKYWFQFDEIKIFVDARTHRNYKDGNVTLILTEWKVLKTGKYRYTVRRKSNKMSCSDDSNKRINLDNLLKQ